MVAWGVVRLDAVRGIRGGFGLRRGEWRVIGLGTVSSLDIEIPATYKGYPVTEIGERAFYEQVYLESVEISDSIISIGSSAFEYCKSLTIYCEAGSKPSGWTSGWNPNNRPVEWGYKETA
ncbi:MAG: leucine-rich repeat protein [Clostridia bacterium]|nr:leucine-rich repeat protein [Clostridia bacterium]